VATSAPTRPRRLSPVLREGGRVTPLELFFDLVFVLAITQCTALMAAKPTWTGLGEGLLILGLLWWAWTGYAWLTSVVDPEEGAVRLDHFAERHGLIVIIALGESIVAIGVGAQAGVDAGVVTAAVLGVATAAALWWLYFDVVALVAARRLSNAAEGRERNEVARDSFSYLHFPMVAGIVLLALGLKKTLGHVEDPLKTVPAVAMLGGTALYLLAHVAFRWRNVHRLSVHRMLGAAALLALLPAAVELPALATLGIETAVLSALIVYETHRFAELRDRLRHQLAG
jgi:low temperature requirement protein LtrA